MAYRKAGSRLREWKALVQTLNIKKVWNFFLLFLSYQISRFRRKPMHWGMPFSISVEPTTSCNLRCPECPSGLRSFTRATGMLNSETFSTVIRQLKPWLGNLTFYFQGEPYLNPAFLDLVEMAEKNGVYTSTSTNAHYLNHETAIRTVRSGLRRIIISIDGARQESYEKYRIGGKLEKVLEGTRNLVNARKGLGSATPYIIFQFLVVKPNEEDIPEIIRLAREYGVDEVKLKTAQIYDYENGHALIPDQEQFSRYRKDPDGKYRIKNALLNQCWKMWHSAVITWDGNVLPCCFDKDARHKLGNLNETEFRKVWKSEPYQKFRAGILNSRSSIDICTNCTEGLDVWAETI